MSILVANALSAKGEMIGRFLKNQGFNVIGIDKFKNDSQDVFSSFFKINLRHSDSVKLVYTLTQPAILIYPWVPIKERFVYPDYSGIELFNLLSLGKSCLEKVILVIEDTPDCECDLDSGFECMQEFLLSAMLREFGEEFKFENYVISKKDNLLKIIKQILKEGGKTK